MTKTSPLWIPISGSVDQILVTLLPHYGECKEVPIHKVLPEQSLHTAKRKGDYWLHTLCFVCLHVTHGTAKEKKKNAYFKYSKE